MFPPGFFDRMDPTPDPQFYRPPRLVTHIDDRAIAAVGSTYAELSVDGESKTYWVNSTNVASALGEIGRRFAGADLSTSRGSSIGRTGLSLQVVTPKVVRIKLGAKDLRKHKVTALTVADVLESMGFEVDKHDEVTPSLATEIAPGDKVVVMARTLPSGTDTHAWLQAAL